MWIKRCGDFCVCTVVQLWQEGVECVGGLSLETDWRAGLESLEGVASSVGSRRGIWKMKK